VRRPVELESYFDFLAPDDVRIRGTRIGIESILYEYIHRGQTPEAIAARFYTLSLEQIYATILYYLRNREQLDAYLADWLAFGHAARAAQEQNPPPVVLRLRQRKAEQQAVQ
jgi:uncharacterized protein (DUF433 family)